MPVLDVEPKKPASQTDPTTDPKGKPERKESPGPKGETDIEIQPEIVIDPKAKQ